MVYRNPYTETKRHGVKGGDDFTLLVPPLLLRRPLTDGCSMMKTVDGPPAPPPKEVGCGK